VTNIPQAEDANSLLSRIKPISEEAAALKMLIYGPPGAGKTVLAATAADVPEMCPVLCVDVEGGTLSIRDKKVSVLRVKTFAELIQLLEILRSGHHNWKTVVIDSLTEVQKLNMYEVMRRVTTQDPTRDPDMPGLREYGKNTEQIRRLIRGYRDLVGTHVIFTALTNEVKDERTGVVKTLPALTGKLAVEVPGFLDIVAYLSVAEQDGAEVRVLVTDMTTRVLAKHRAPISGVRLPKALMNPLMGQIYQVVCKQEEVKSSSQQDGDQNQNQKQD